jgi:hypothetical protein
MANIQIHEFHIKVRWLFGLATCNERSQLPREFPKFGLLKDVVEALGATQQTFGMWCPLNPKKKDGTPAPQMDKPPAAFARNVARMFGFAPQPDGVDDDEVWSEWWANDWSCFTPRETNAPTNAPAAEFTRRYLDALATGKLKFQKPIIAPANRARARPPAPPPPLPPNAEKIAGLTEQFRTELATEPRLGNVAKFILDLLENLRDLPDPSLWTGVHLDQLRNVQELLTVTFDSGDGLGGDGAISFGTLAPLLRARGFVCRKEIVGRSFCRCRQRTRSIFGSYSHDDQRLGGGRDADPGPYRCQDSRRIPRRR